MWFLIEECRRLSSLHPNAGPLLAIRVAGAGCALTSATALLVYDRLEIRPLSVTLLLAMFSAAQIVWTLMGAYLADRYGRRWALLIAIALMTLGYALYGAAGSYNGCAAGEVVLGIAFGLYFPILNSIARDSLKAGGNTSQYFSFVAGSAKLFTLTAMLTSLIGGLAGAYSAELPFWLAAGMNAAALPFAWRLKDVRPAYQRASVGADLAAIGRQVVSSRVLPWLLGAVAVVNAFSMAGWFLYPYYFAHCALPVVYFGAILAAFNASAALMQHFTLRLEARLGLFSSVLLILALLAAGYLLMSGLSGQTGFLVIFLHQMARGYAEPVLTRYLNDIIEDGCRSTMNALSTAAWRMVYILIILPVGWLMQNKALPSALFFLAVGLAAAGLFIMLVAPRRRIKEVAPR